MGIFKILTKIDLILSPLDADEVVRNTAPKGEGAFRRVWVGNYSVLKRCRTIPLNGFPVDLGGGVMNRKEKEIWDAYKHLGILAPVHWVSSDYRYLMMEVLNTSPEEKSKKIKTCFRDFYFGEESVDNSALALRRACVILNCVKKHGKTTEATRQIKAHPYWDGRIDPKYVDFDKPLIKAILQLPEEVIIDLHFGNWGVDENGSLKIIDYAGV